jgi:hypothetical protein
MPLRRANCWMENTKCLLERQIASREIQNASWRGIFNYTRGKCLNCKENRNHTVFFFVSFIKYNSKKIKNMENKRTLGDDPQYFGAYLNMARLNIYNINNHLAKKFKIGQLDDEEQIPSSFLGNKELKEFKNNQNYIYSELKRFMPIVKVFDDETLPKNERDNITNKYGRNFISLSDTLKVVFKELNDFRNDYSHYYSIKTTTNRKITVSNEMKDFLNQSFKRAIEYSKERFVNIFNDADFNLALETSIVKEDNTITQDGIVFLIVMFLDRENAFQFINKIIGLKGTQLKVFKAKREVLSAFCVKLPHEKFTSEDNIQAFSLELINELNKCPKPLYNIITDTEKQSFIPQIGDDERENILDNSIPDTIDDYQNYIESITKRVRNENRFSYFALKFIDEKKIFDKIRFQIDLGKVVLDEYSKTINNIAEPRRVVENAKAFGRLQDIKNNEELMLNKINTGSNKTYFEQFAPHYNFDINKIGLNLSREDAAKFIYRPNSDKKVKAYLKQPEVDAFLSVHELPKIILLEYLEKGKAETIINDFIKINNNKLFNLQFIETIKLKLNGLDIFQKRSQGRKQNAAYKDSDLNNLIARKQQLNLVLNEHNLNDKQIPTTLLDYWLNINDVEEKTAISDKIKLMKRDCINRLKAIKKGNEPKIGEMATFLAKDIVDMIIDVKKKEKITSFYYDKMQQCLALYADAEKKSIFIQLYKELGLNETGGHPFLSKISFQNLRYTADIYKSYLEEKGMKIIKTFNSRTNKNTEKDMSWLEVNFYKKEWNEKAKKNMTVVKIDDHAKNLPYTIKQLEKEKGSFNNWFTNVTKGKEANDRKKPIDLPTNLFDTALEKILINRLKVDDIPFNERLNHNELFKLWWEKSRKDSTQEFYNAEREYIFDGEKLNFKINTKAKFEEYYKGDFLNKVYASKQKARILEQKVNKRIPDVDKLQVEKSIRNKIGSREKLIRILQEEDRLMLLMFEQLLDDNLNLKLKDIETLLNETILVKQKIEGPLSFDDVGEIIKEDVLKNKISKNITENRKRKEFSVLKKSLLND